MMPNNGSNNLANVRILMWEKLYPGYMSDFEEVFGDRYPAVKKVSRWKNNWYDRTPYKMRVDPVANRARHSTRVLIQATTERIGVHPYFWDFWVEPAELSRTGYPTVSFFKEEHLVMFKLAWP